MRSPAPQPRRLAACDLAHRGRGAQCHGDHGRCAWACARATAASPATCEVRRVRPQVLRARRLRAGRGTPDCAGRRLRRPLLQREAQAPPPRRRNHPRRDPRWGAEAAALPPIPTVAARLGGCRPTPCRSRRSARRRETAYLLAANSEPPELPAVDLRAARRDVAAARPPADGRPPPRCRRLRRPRRRRRPSTGRASDRTREGAAPAVVQVARRRSAPPRRARRRRRRSRRRTSPPSPSRRKARPATASARSSSPSSARLAARAARRSTRRRRRRSSSCCGSPRCSRSTLRASASPPPSPPRTSTRRAAGSTC